MKGSFNGPDWCTALIRTDIHFTLIRRDTPRKKVYVTSRLGETKLHLEGIFVCASSGSETHHSAIIMPETSAGFKLFEWNKTLASIPTSLATPIDGCMSIQTMTNRVYTDAYCLDANMSGVKQLIWEVHAVKIARLREVKNCVGCAGSMIRLVISRHRNRQGMHQILE